MPDGRKLYRLLRQVQQGDLPPQLVEATVLTMIRSSCQTCGQLLAGSARELARIHLMEALGRLWCSGPLEQWKQEGQRDFVTLLKLPDWGSRDLRVERAYRRFRSPALVARLLAEARLLTQHDPAEAAQYARLAENVSRRGAAAATAGCLALSVAYRGNALRALGKLTEAAGAMARAQQLAEILRPPAWVEAEISSLAGSLQKDKRDLPAAVASLKSALSGFLAQRDRVGAARVQLILASCSRLEGKLETAVDQATMACHQLDLVRDPRLFVWAHHNVAVYLTEAGMPARARAIVEILSPIAAVLPDLLPRLRMRWLEALIAREEGDNTAAEVGFEAVIAGFVTQGSAFLAALTALDLAQVYLRSGRAAELAQLAAALPPIFESEGVQDEAVGAVLLFAKAARDGAVTFALLSHLRCFLEHAQVDRSIQYVPPK